MSLWGDDDDQIPVSELQNSYLSDPKKGLELIARLMSFKADIESVRKIRNLDYLIDEGLLNAARSLNLDNEVNLSIQLNKLSDKIEQDKKLRLLGNKTIIGIGGEFSSGKSKFINALLNGDILPEDQTPTTSIPTYILNSHKDSIFAYTANNQEIELDLDAMQALTHKFYDKYKLGFSQFIRNLIVKSCSIEYKNIAILDTPGYNKYDSDEKKTFSDEKKAFEQLKSSDFLIWLVDVANGVIKAKDIDFILSLGMMTPVLIVFNKADKETDYNLKDIIEKSRSILEKKGIKPYGISAYSSLDAKEYFDTNYISQFLKTASEYSDRKEDISKQLKNVISSLKMTFSDLKQQTIEEHNVLGDAIFHSEDILSIRSLVELYADSFDQLNTIEDCQRNLKLVSDKIYHSLKNIT